MVTTGPVGMTEEPDVRGSRTYFANELGGPAVRRLTAFQVIELQLDLFVYGRPFEWGADSATVALTVAGTVARWPPIAQRKLSHGRTGIENIRSSADRKSN
jgi:hypothetical protein